METALEPGTPVIHPELGDNLCFERVHDTGDVDEALRGRRRGGRGTPSTSAATPGVSPEPRAILADYNPGEQRLTVYHSTQAPHMMQDMFAKHLGLPEGTCA